jgi:hypothetical protein
VQSDLKTASQKRYYLDDEWHDYIAQYKVEKGFGTVNNALTNILIEHKELSNKLFDLRFIVGELSNELLKGMKNSLHESVAEEMRRIRLGTNNTDRNTQILIELLQAYMFVNNVTEITTTDVFKPEFLNQAERIVHDRIIHQKQKKDSK